MFVLSADIGLSHMCMQDFLADMHIVQGSKRPFNILDHASGVLKPASLLAHPDCARSNICLQISPRVLSFHSADTRD